MYEGAVEGSGFAAAFAAAKERIRRMEVRYVQESDANRQALLEIYATLVLKTHYNDFDTQQPVEGPRNHSQLSAQDLATAVCDDERHLVASPVLAEDVT